MKSPIIAYHFTAIDHLRDGSPIPANGEWLTVPSPIRICELRLHASLHPSDALSFAPGPMLHLVQLAGDIQQQSDKLCASRRLIGARFDATELLRADARASARSCLHLWSPPAIVVQWLETGDESIRSAARSAAESAAESAARSVAWSAARSAARSAAWSAARSAAESAAESAARSAAWSVAESAARSAAWSVAESAARSAARSAAESAAESAARSAAWSAAWIAAWSAARIRLKAAVDAKFLELGVRHEDLPTAS